LRTQSIAQDDERIVKVDGARLRYRIEGHGEPCPVVGSSVCYPRMFSPGLREGLQPVFADSLHFATPALRFGIAAPVLIAHGRYDYGNPCTLGEKTRHQLPPQHTFVLFDKSGHFVPIEEPERFDQALIEWGARPLRSARLRALSGGGDRLASVTLSARSLVDD
jgi:hypothetical protein